MANNRKHRLNLSGDILNQPFAIWGLLLLSFVFWMPALQNGFTNWDDHVYLTDNTVIKTLSITNIQTLFSSWLMGNYHPLVPLSFMLEHHFFGMNPFVYHLVNLLLHLANGWMVYQLMVHMLAHRPAALFAAGFFLLHPLHVESVAWVTERKDVLYTFFFLLACLQWWRFRADNKKVYYILSIVFFILSCLSKGMAVVWPAWLVLQDIRFRMLNHKQAPFAVEFTMFKWYIVPGLLALGFGILAMYAQQSEGAVRPDSPFLFPDNILVASHGILFYLVKTLLPTGLSAFYPYPEPARSFPWYFYAAPVLVLGITVFLIWVRKQHPLWTIAWLGYVFILLPVSQLLPVGSAMAADRYFYLASLGVCVAVGLVFINIHERFGKYSAIGMLLVAFVVWGMLTRERTMIWKSTETLFLDVISKYPNVPVAYNNIGNEYEAKKQYAVARDWYLQSVQQRANYPEGLMNMGVIYERLNRYDSALYYYDQLKQYFPNRPGIDNTIANALNKWGNRLREEQKWDEAEARFRLALVNDENYTEAWNNLGNLLYATGRRDSGLIFLQEAVRRNPDYAEAWSNMGSIYGASGKTDSAAICFTQAVTLQPDYAPAWFNLGYARSLLGDVSGAKDAFQKAAALGHTGAQNILKSIP
jgi:tetratricopeptide (TPR) repeat protein